MRANGRVIGVRTRRKSLRQALVCWISFVRAEMSTHTNVADRGTACQLAGRSRVRMVPFLSVDQDAGDTRLCILEIGGKRAVH